MKTSLPVDGPIRTANLEPTRLMVFFLITFGFTWFFWMPDALAKMGTIPASPLTGLGFVGAFGPLIAAIIVTSIYEGKSGLLVLFKRAVDYSFKKRWWFFVTL